MFEPIPDVAAVVIFLLPGFLAVSLFDVTNPSLARDRLPLQWTMWSLASSLLLYAGAYGLYSAFDLPRDPLDYQFFIPLIGLSALIGWSLGRIAGSRDGRLMARRLRLFIRAWVWVEVLTEEKWLVVHLKDGTKLYGFPHRFTDDRRETIREIYLTNARRFNEQTAAFEPIDESDGVLVTSTEIAYITVLKDLDELSEATVAQ